MAMARSVLLVGLVVSLAVLPARAQAPDRVDALLTLGIAQVGEGDFETAVFTLDSVIRRLALRPERQKDLARAYLYLGAAYLSLDHESAAEGKFREALRHAPTLRPSADEFPPKVIQVFDAQVLKRTAAKARRGRKVALILGGLGGAAALGVATATGGKENRPPTARISISPEGQAIVGVTTMTFHATGTDPDADPLSFVWEFGDGARSAGETVTHLYARPGAFSVTLTATDPVGAVGTVTRALTARTLDGTWNLANQTDYACAQTGPAVACQALGPLNYRTLRFALADPRRIVDGELVAAVGRSRCLDGEVRSDLDRITCIVNEAVPRPEIFDRR